MRRASSVAARARRARRPSLPCPTSSAPRCSDDHLGASRTVRRAAARTSSRTPATPVALSLAPGTVGASRRLERRAPRPARARRAGPRGAPARRAPPARSASSGTRASELRRLRLRGPGVARRHQPRVPHQAGVGGVVVGDQHDACATRRPCAGSRPTTFVPLPRRQQPPQPLRAAAVLELERERARPPPGSRLARHRRPRSGARAPRRSCAGSGTARARTSSAPRVAQAAARPTRRTARSPSLAERARSRRAPRRRSLSSRCQSTGPAVSTWLPSGRPSTLLRLARGRQQPLAGRCRSRGPSRGASTRGPRSRCCPVAPLRHRAAAQLAERRLEGAHARLERRQHVGQPLPARVVEVRRQLDVGSARARLRRTRAPGAGWPCRWCRRRRSPRSRRRPGARAIAKHPLRAAPRPRRGSRTTPRSRPRSAGPPRARGRPRARGPASDSSIERFTFFWLCVSLAERKTLISWKRSRSSSAFSSPFSLGISTDTDTSSGMSARRSTSAPSASCGITSARTKLVTSSRRRPVRASISTSRTLSSVGITSGSFWKPSRGPTSRMLTASHARSCARPPLTPSVCPVTYEASSQARKAIAAATSSGWPEAAHRGGADHASARSAPPARRAARARAISSGVSIGPGATALQVTP